MIVNPAQIVSFIYPTFDEATGLYVAASIYDVSSGTPVFITKTGMADTLGDGIYVGQFTPAAGVSYLVVMLVYTDAGFTTVDSNRSPGAENYDAFSVNTALLNFNYGAYDQASNLTITANVLNLTDVSQATASMVHVLGGIYFGHYQGVVGKSYAVLKVPTDLTRPPGSDNFQAYTLGQGGSVTINLFGEAVLIGQSLASDFCKDDMLTFTQGDAVVLQMTAKDGNGDPVNLTGASFTSYVRGSNGASNVSLNNSKHAIVDAVNGQYSITLSTSDSAACGEGANKDLVTVVTIGSTPIYYHGQGILTVLPPLPLF